MSPIADRQFYTVREFCHRNSIGKTTFYALVKSGMVTTVKMGTRTLVPSYSEKLWHESLARSSIPTPGSTHAAAAVTGEPRRTGANGKRRSMLSRQWEM